MRLYICIDGSYAGTQEEAKAKGKGFSLSEVPTDKAGLIDYLNGMVDEARGSSFDAQGELTTVYTGPLVPAPTAPRAPSYTEQSIQLDDDFDRLPLARQLDLAARAMENARARL